MDIKKLQEVLQDEEFTQSLIQLDQASDVAKALQQKGVDITSEEVEKIRDVIVRYQNDELTDYEKSIMNNIKQNDGELNNDDLENVTGGFVEWIILAAGTLLVAAVFTASATNRRW